MADDLERLPFRDAAAWRAWLEANHDSSPGISMVIAKKGRGVESVTYDGALDEALCFGWIDGRRNALDDTYYLQRFTPRRKRSRWSQINVDRVARLEAEGRMQPAGRHEVEAAKADGRWDAAYASPSKVTVPDDLQAALDASPGAAALFAQLDSANRFAILHRIDAVKRAETRTRRIAGFVADLERGVTPYPRKGT